MNIHKATQSYENWMRSCTAVIEAHLRLKHKQMRESPFLFFRGTFYRWAQLWPNAKRAGIAREAGTFGTADPTDPAKLVVTTSHPAAYTRRVAVYVPDPEEHTSELQS